MKKSLILLIWGLLAFSLVSCGNSSSQNNSNNNNDNSNKTEEVYVAVESLEISGKNYFDMSKTPTVQYTAVLTPENATTSNLTWSVDKPKIATVDETGLVTGLTAGEIILKVRDSKVRKYATKSITILNDGTNMTDEEGVEGADKSKNNVVNASVILTASSPSNPSSFTNLVWSDEFNGNSLSSFWTVQQMKGSASGNREQQEYIDDESTLKVHDGVLEIIANEKFKSARIETAGKVGVQFGKIEARLKFDQGLGSWPAFWMLGYNIDQSNKTDFTKHWPNCGEIDIMEHANDEPFINSTNHWNALGINEDDFEDGNAGGKAVLEDGREWHVYGVIWTDTYIQYTLDGENTFIMEYKNAEGYLGDGMECFDDPYYILFNFAMGGTFVKRYDTSKFTNVPWRMFVDWVRVYQ